MYRCHDAWICAILASALPHSAAHDDDDTSKSVTSHSSLQREVKVRQKLGGNVRPSVYTEATGALMMSLMMLMPFFATSEK